MPEQLHPFTKRLMKNMDPNDVANKKNRGEITIELTYKPFKEDHRADHHESDDYEDGESNDSPIVSAAPSVLTGPIVVPPGGGLLVVIVHQAEDLEGKYHNNPYVKVTFRGEQRRTKASGSLYPEFEPAGASCAHCNDLRLQTTITASLSYALPSFAFNTMPIFYLDLEVTEFVTIFRPLRRAEIPSGNKILSTHWLIRLSMIACYWRFVAKAKILSTPGYLYHNFHCRLGSRLPNWSRMSCSKFQRINIRSYLCTDYGSMQVSVYEMRNTMVPMCSRHCKRPFYDLPLFNIICLLTAGNTGSSRD